MSSYIELKGINECWKSITENNQVRMKKRTIISADDAYIYMVLKGSVCLRAQSDEGEEKILWYLSHGCLFNETPAFLKENLSNLPQMPL
ncbi:MAG: cyclic nucleotide-binding domain-containing protein, partial [Desulfovibrionaceae bacterium]|nr:cyclic nucleotide-binding domain-containing protein [Desulfovibrionaceae bacterium]